MKIFGLDISRSSKSNKFLSENTKLESNNLLRQDLQNNLDEFSFPYLNTSNLTDLWNQSSDRKLRYQSYDQMSVDSIISSALELYADDASQYDADNRLLWVESENSEITKKLNNRLRELGLDGKLWSMYYSLAKYGEVYLRQYKYRETNSDGSSTFINDQSSDDPKKELIKYEPYISIVDKPENVFDLSKYGKTQHFAYLNEGSKSATNNYIGTDQKRSVEIYPPDQFVHIYLDKPDARSHKEQVFQFESKSSSKKDDSVQETYDVIEGMSMLDGIYAVQRQIQLLETSIILNRLSKSAITRIVSVEIGDMSSKDVPAVLRRIKSSLENRISLDSSNGMNDYTSSPGGLDNVVVVPTREGKGAISTSNIGGDVDVKSLSDLDYFNNKRFGGLKIPKAFLGYEESLGNNGGGTLTKQDIRYGRTIKRLQTAMVSGITRLLTWYLKEEGYTSLDLTNFVVKVVPPTTADDDERDAMQDSKFKLANNILDMLGDDIEDRSEVLKYIFTNIINEPGLTEMLSKEEEKKNSAPKDVDSEVPSEVPSDGTTNITNTSTSSAEVSTPSDSDDNSDSTETPSSSHDELKTGTSSSDEQPPKASVPAQSSIINDNNKN